MTLSSEAVRAEPDLETGPAPRVGTAPRVGAAERWAAVAGFLTLLAAGAGLFVGSTYSSEPLATQAMLRSYDLVTATVALPALAGSLVWARRGSSWARLVCAALLAYLVYTYAYYLLGTGYSILLPLHAALIASAAIGLIGQLTTLDRNPFAGWLQGRGRVRGVATVLGLLAAALGGMWIYTSLDAATTGTVPAGSQLVESALIVHLGIALDLSLLVPLYAAAAVLLVRSLHLGLRARRRVGRRRHPAPAHLHRRNALPGRSRRSRRGRPRPRRADHRRGLPTGRLRADPPRPPSRPSAAGHRADTAPASLPRDLGEAPAAPSGRS